MIDRDAPSQRQPIPVVRPGQAERIEVARKMMTLAAMHEQLGGPHGTSYLVHPTAAVLELAQSFAEDQPDAVGAYAVYPESGPPSHVLRLVINSTTIEIFGITATEAIDKSAADARNEKTASDRWTREQAAQRNLGVMVMIMAVSPEAPR